jgi:exonuclease VII large subunit
MASVLRARLRDGSSRAALVEQRIASVVRARLAAWRGDWETLAAGLHAQSPLAVLKKGYTLVWGRESAAPGAARRPIISVADVRAGGQVAVSFFKGEFTAVVESVDPDKEIQEGSGLNIRHFQKKLILRKPSAGG